MTPGIDADLVRLAGGLYDLQVASDGDLATKDAFDAAIVVSLLADRRATENEAPNPRLRRGWIGNEATPGIEIGSKLWLFEQSRLTRTSLNGAADAAREALAWFVEDGLAESIEGATPVVTSDGARLQVSIRRPTSEVERRFFDLWERTGV